MTHVEFLIRKFIGQASKVEMVLPVDFEARTSRFLTSFSQNLEDDFNEYAELFAIVSYALTRALYFYEVATYTRERFEKVTFRQAREDLVSQGIMRPTNDSVLAAVFESPQHEQLTDKVFELGILRGLGYTLRDMVRDRKDFLLEAARTRRKEQ